MNFNRKVYMVQHSDQEKNNVSLSTKAKYSMNMKTNKAENKTVTTIFRFLDVSNIG